MSRSCRLSWWSFMVLPLSARLPWVSLRAFFAEDVRCRPGVEGAFLAEAHRLPAQLHEVLSLRSLEIFHLGFCGAGFWLWFSPWLFAQTYLPFSDSCLKVDSFVFSPALHRWPLRSLVQRVVFTTYVSIFSSGRFWLTLLCYPTPLHGVPAVVPLGFASHLRS